MEKRAAVLAVCAVVGFGLSLGCAIRKDLKTLVPEPTNAPAVDARLGSDPARGTKFCAPDGSGQFPGEAVAMQSGQAPADGSAWAIGGGCVLRPIREVWAAISNLQAMRFGGSDSMEWAPATDAGTQYVHVYDLTYHKQAPIISSISWVIRWYHGVGRGTFAQPSQVNINYQRTHGTFLIPIWNGGLVLDKVTSTVTSLAIRNNFKASQSSGENEASARSAVAEMIRKARTVSPDWVRLDDGQSASLGERVPEGLDGERVPGD